MRTASILSAILLIAACSGSTGGGTGGSNEDAGGGSSSGGGSGSGSGSGGSSGGGSSSSGGKASSSSGSSSGGKSGSSSGSKSGSSSGSGADGGFVCESPADCPQSTPVCCANIPITGGTIPNCTNGTPSVACSTNAACPINLGTTCSGTETLQLCAKTADCANAGANNECCTFGNGNGALTFCASALVAGLGGGTCQ